MNSHGGGESSNFDTCFTETAANFPFAEGKDKEICQPLNFEINHRENKAVNLSIWGRKKSLHQSVNRKICEILQSVRESGVKITKFAQLTSVERGANQ